MNWNWQTQLRRSAGAEGGSTPPAPAPEPPASPAPAPAPDPDPNPNPNPTPPTSTPSPTPVAPAVPPANEPPNADPNAPKPSLATAGDEDKNKDLAGNPLPEKYEIKAKDGFIIDEAVLPKANDFFKANRFTPEQAQAATDFMQDFMSDQVKQHTARVSEWETQAKKDTYFTDAGGFDRNLAIVRTAVQEYGDQELREVFDFTGVGSHPAMLRFIKKMSRGLGEAKAPTSETNNRGQGLSHAETLYPNMVKRDT